MRFISRLAVAWVVAVALPLMGAEDPLGPMLGVAGTTAPDQNGDGVYDAADLVRLVQSDPAAAEARVIAAVTVQMDALVSTRLEDQRAELLAWLAAQPDVAASGLSPDNCVWLRTTTGLPILIMTNEKMVGAPDPGASLVNEPATGARRQVPQSAQPIALVEGTKADFMEEVNDVLLPTDNSALIVLSTTETWPSYRWAYSFVSSLYARGFEIAPLGFRLTASLAEYRALPPLSVAITQGHGGMYRDQDFAPDAPKVAAGEHLVLWTNVPVEEGDLLRYRPEMRAKRAVVSIGGIGMDAVGNVTNGARWAISAEWVKEYFNFTYSSIWSCHSCSGYNQEMIDAAQSKGLDVYMGWTKPIYSNFGPSVSAVVASRTMGGGPYGYGDPCDAGRNRPLALEDAYREAQQLGNTTDASEGAELKIARRTGSQFLQIAPSIINVQADEALGEVIIRGQFGPDPGARNRAATINWQPLEVVSWDMYVVRATLPPGGPSSIGDVRVTRFGCPSNRKPLIRYATTINVDIHFSTGESAGSATIPTSVRLDPLPYRLVPNGPLRYTDGHAEFLAGWSDPLSYIHTLRIQGEMTYSGYTYAENSSEARYQYDGSYPSHDDCGVWTASGSGTVPNLAIDPATPPPDQPSVLIPFGLISIDPPLRVEMRFDTSQATGTVRASDPDCGEYEEDLLNLYGTPPDGLPLPISETYGLPGGTATGSGAPSEIRWSPFTQSMTPVATQYGL